MVYDSPYLWLELRWLGWLERVLCRYLVCAQFWLVFIKQHKYMPSDIQLHKVFLPLTKIFFIWNINHKSIWINWCMISSSSSSFVICLRPIFTTSKSWRLTSHLNFSSPHNTTHMHTGQSDSTNSQGCMFVNTQTSK